MGRGGGRGGGKGAGGWVGQRGTGCLVSPVKNVVTAGKFEI